MYRLGKHSLHELDGVHPDLVCVVKRAIRLTEADFTVHDGLRLYAEQVEYVRTGVSRTMNSKHLEQTDGFGHAVDLVPYINGKLRWEWPPIYRIAEAVRQAADESGVRIRWGGTWNALNGTTEKPEQLLAQAQARRAAIGRKHFADGPHFELLKG